MFCFLKPRERERNPAIMRGRVIVEAGYSILAGIYPDFYGWRYYYFVLFMTIIHPGLYTYYIICYIATIYIAFAYDDKPLMAQALCLSTLTYIYCAVSVVFMAKKPEMDALIELVGNGFSNYSRPATDKERTFEENVVKGTHRMALYCSGLISTLCVCSMGVLPALKAVAGEHNSITNTTSPINRNTPLPIWTPHETTSISYYLIAFVFQFISGCLELVIVIACCIIYIGACRQLLGGLEALIRSLRELPARALYLFADQGGIGSNFDKLYKNELFLDCLNKCLSENIRHHQNLIVFYSKILETMGFSILAIFTGTGITISAAAYSTYLSIESEEYTTSIILDTLVWLLYIIIYVFLLVMYCTNGQKVMDKSEALHRAWYDTPWIEADLRFRKSIIICMINCQQRMGITAFGLITASNETLLDIIKTSFSYLNMLMAAR